MKAFLDTNVLVAVIYEDHPHHTASFELFTRFEKKKMSCGAHSLAEVYSTLTRMPGRHRIDSVQAMLFIREIRDRITIIGLTPDEYFEALETFAALGILGGAIYDAVLAKCALKSHAEKLFTWNRRDYERLGPDIVARLHTP